MVTRPRQGGRRAGRQAQLVTAALDCIATLGLRDTTVQDLAQRAGMAVGSINQYFTSKEALYTAALRSLAQEFEQHWHRSLQHAGENPAARLGALVDAYFDPSVCQRRKVAVWFAYWGEVRARPQYRAVCEGFDRSFGAAMEASIRELVAADAVAEQQIKDLARLLSATCQGLWLEFLSASDRPSRVALRDIARRQLATLFPAQAEAFNAGGRASAPHSRVQEKGRE